MHRRPAARPSPGPRRSARSRAPTGRPHRPRPRVSLVAAAGPRRCRARLRMTRSRRLGRGALLPLQDDACSAAAAIVCPAAFKFTPSVEQLVAQRCNLMQLLSVVLFGEHFVKTRSDYRIDCTTRYVSRCSAIRMKTLSSAAVACSRLKLAHTELAAGKTLVRSPTAAESYHTARDQSTPSSKRSHRHRSDAGAKPRDSPTTKN